MGRRPAGELARLATVGAIVVTGWVVTGITFLFALTQGQAQWAGPLVAAIGIETILSFYALMNLTGHDAERRASDRVLDFALSVVAGVVAIGAATFGTTLLH